MKYSGKIGETNQYRGNLPIVLMIFFIASLNPSCHRTEIVLETVSDLPEYFLDNIRFGRDIQSIYELKDFLLVTGKVDTTSEFPALRVAVIAISKNKIFLTLKKTQVKNGETHETYKGDGYNLYLRYKEKQQNQAPVYYGYLVLSCGTSKCEYEVVGCSAYR